MTKPIPCLLYTSYGKAEWTGKEFSLIDTGGWVINSDDVFEEEINKQVKVALEEMCIRDSLVHTARQAMGAGGT